MQDSKTTGSGRFAENPGTTARTAAAPQTKGNRRFADLTLTGEVTLTVIKEPGSSFAAHGDGELFSGSILHISETAALIETERAAPEGALLALNAPVESGEEISHTLALVTRIDQEDEAWIMGLSLVGRGQLADILSGAELELLDRKFGSFTAQVKCLLSQRQVNGQEA